MDTPQRNYRYIITQDNGQTVRLMRVLFDGDTPRINEADCYTLLMGDPKPYMVDGVRESKVTLDTEGYALMMTTDVWDNDLFTHLFEVVKVVEVRDYSMRPPMAEPVPTVYFVPDDE